MDRLLAKGRLVDLFEYILTIEDPYDGSYMLYTDKGTIELRSDMMCYIILSLLDDNDDDDFEPPIALEKEIEAVAEIDIIKRIIRKAQTMKSELSTEEIVKAINYYLDNDSFIIC